MRLRSPIEDQEGHREDLVEEAEGRAQLLPTETGAQRNGAEAQHAPEAKRDEPRSIFKHHRSTSTH